MGSPTSIIPYLAHQRPGVLRFVARMVTCRAREARQMALPKACMSWEIVTRGSDSLAKVLTQ